MNPSPSADAVPVPPKHPKGLWVLVLTETWERMSHYGMRAILILYLTAPVALGGLGLDTARAAAIMGGYLFSIYLFALSGGQIADRFLGAKRTIVLGGVFIAAGQFGLQVHSVNALIGSLVVISVGTCLMKPNISASIGRLYTKEDPRRDGAFTIEYSAMNFGAFVAPLICGFMAENPRFIGYLSAVGLTSKAGWAWAFGVTGVGMLIGLLNFVLRQRLVRDVSLAEGQSETGTQSIPFVIGLVAVLLGMATMVIWAESVKVQLLGGVGASVLAMGGVQLLISKGIVKARAVNAPSSVPGEADGPAKLTREDWTRIGVVGMMLCFSIIFWAVYQQAGSTLTIYARDYTDRVVLGWSIPASWFQSVNAVLIVTLGPVFAWIWTKRAGRWPSSPEKFALGLLFVAAGFLLLVPASRIAQAIPGRIVPVGVGWLGGVYLLHTIGELCLSPVGLSYVSRLAPKQITSQLMGTWFFSIGVGSWVAGRAAGLMESMSLATLFGLFAAVAVAAAMVLLLVVNPIIRRLMGGHS